MRATGNGQAITLQPKCIHVGSGDFPPGLLRMWCAWTAPTLATQSRPQQRGGAVVQAESIVLRVRALGFTMAAAHITALPVYPHGVCQTCPAGAMPFRKLTA